MKLTAVMLAGRMQESPLREVLDVHVLCLPTGQRGNLLHSWMDVLGSIDELNELQVVVNIQQDANAVRHSVGEDSTLKANDLEVTVIPQPAPWRGAGGILRDVLRDKDDDGFLIVCEGKRLPPASVGQLVEVLREHESTIAGVVGIYGEDQPAGIYAFSASTIKNIPTVGYYDMKEQFIPALCRRGEKIATVHLGEDVLRIRDLESYLSAVHASLCNGSRSGKYRVSERSSISSSAVLDGFCIVESGAVIEDGAVIHESVILNGATIGGGAVVSRSVIGPLAKVAPRGRVVGSLIAHASTTDSSISSNHKRVIRPQRLTKSFGFVRGTK